jgi:hypothetical protein
LERQSFALTLIVALPLIGVLCRHETTDILNTIDDMTSGKTTFTPRERMLAAYEGWWSDCTPVAPEFWYYIPARVLNVPMMTLELEIPHWKALQKTFQHYKCEGWGIVAPALPPDYGGVCETVTRKVDENHYEATTTMSSGGQTLTSTRIYSLAEPSWITERFIKDFDRDWSLYERMTLVPPEVLDWTGVQQALDAVGDAYLLEVFVGFPFIDYAGEPRQGGLEQVILDLCDRESDMVARLDRYITYMRRLVQAVFERTTARSIFIASSWSSMSLLSPAIWRKWEKPVLQAAVETAHNCGGLVHHHFHGKCLKILPDLADLGLDCICPFERPPGGDIVDLSLVRDELADRTAFNGNVHTVETLIRGTPTDVRREVAEILQAFEGSPCLIVGTGDQVGAETPDENIHAMIETVQTWG